MSLWRNGDFLRLWSAQTISAFGSQITFLALPLAAILVLDATAFEVAALTAVEWTPWLLFSLPAGAWVDRLPRRRVLVVTDLGRALLLASIPLAYALDVLTLWQLYGVGFLVGTLTVFFDVAYVAYLPSLVERRQLGEGNSKLETSRSGAQLGGPGLAGLLVELISAPVAILADAISFVVSALFLGAIRKREVVEPRTEGTRLRTEVVEGIRFVLSHPLMRPSMAFVAMSNFFYNVIFAVFLVYAVRELDLSPGTIGLTFTLGNFGVLAGAVLAPRIGAFLGVGPTIIVSAFFLGWPALLIPLAPAEHAVPIFVGVFAVTGFSGILTNVVGISLFQATTPDRLQGRATASRRLVNFGAVPLGSLAGGGLAATIGLRETLWVGAVGSTLAFLPVLFSPIRSIREIPEEPAAPTAAGA
ncbi:MAG: MFS transporter [Gaiellaceae bacterium]